MGSEDFDAHFRVSPEKDSIGFETATDGRLLYLSTCVLLFGHAEHLLMHLDLLGLETQRPQVLGAKPTKTPHI